MHWKIDEPDTSARPTIRMAVAVSSWDRWHALITSGVIVFALLVLVLYGIWLAGFSNTRAVKIGPLPPTSFDQNLETLVLLGDFDMPEISEFPEARVPDIELSLAAVIDSTSTVAASIKERTGDLEESGQKGEGSRGNEKRKPGPQEEDVIPEWERWKIEFTADTRGEYFEMLDSFGIYLGGVSKSNATIYFVSCLSEEKPDLAEGRRDSEEAQLLYFRNTRSEMRRWDRSRIKQAGVDPEVDFIAVQFYPEDVRLKLQELESAQMGEIKKRSEVKKTLFACRRTESGYEFYVKDIEYRPEPDSR